MRAASARRAACATAPNPPSSATAPPGTRRTPRRALRRTRSLHPRSDPTSPARTARCARSTHTRTRTYTSFHTHALTLILIHTLTLTHTHALTLIHTLALSHTLTSTPTPTRHPRPRRTPAPLLPLTSPHLHFPRVRSMPETPHSALDATRRSVAHRRARHEQLAASRAARSPAPPSLVRLCAPPRCRSASAPPPRARRSSHRPTPSSAVTLQASGAGRRNWRPPSRRHGRRRACRPQQQQQQQRAQQRRRAQRVQADARGQLASTGLACGCVVVAVSGASRGARRPGWIPRRGALVSRPMPPRRADLRS